MSLSKIAGVVLGSAALVAGHGYVSGAVVDGTYYGGYLVDQYPYSNDPPEVIAWSEDETDLGYIDGTGYSSSNIICHKDAQPGALSAPVKAGGSVELQWTDWPTSHHGPVITYLANCNGDCSDVDKTTLKFFKIDQGGLIDDSDVPGTWATDKLISNNNSRTITIPSTIESGNYVLRHEIIALHSAGNKDGAQNYPQCLNLKVTGGGSDSPSGTLGTELYKDTDPGILVNIYTSLSSYTIPGPALYTGGASSGSATVTSAPSATSAARGTIGPISSAPASTVSASPIRSPPAFPHSRNSTRVPRPTIGRNPGSPPAASSRPQFSQPAEPQNPPGAAASTVTETATAQVTDQPAFQTPSAQPDTMTVTASAGGQSAQSSSPAEGEAPIPSASATPSSVPSTGGSDSGSSSSSSGSSSSSSSSSDSGSGSTTTTSGSDASDYNSSDWSSYLSSLSAEQVLSLLRQTFKWLVTDKKHARDLSN